VRALSGGAADAALCLAALAAAQPPGRDALVASDGLVQMLGCWYAFTPLGGGYLLVPPPAARHAFDLALTGGPAGAAGVAAGEAESLAAQSSAGSNALGGMGCGRGGSGGAGGAGLPLCTARPRRGLGQLQHMAAAARRQAIRKQYEALEVLLAQGEGLKRVPEYLLTQPPPVRPGALQWWSLWGRGGGAAPRTAAGCMQHSRVVSGTAPRVQLYSMRIRHQPLAGAERAAWGIWRKRRQRTGGWPSRRSPLLAAAHGQGGPQRRRRWRRPAGGPIPTVPWRGQHHNRGHRRVRAPQPQQAAPLWGPRPCCSDRA
jgi:hypothetical protein